MNYGFIGGYGRSGTTAAMLAMSKSPQVFPLMETQLLNEAVFPYLDGKIHQEQFKAAYRRFVGQPKDMEFGGRKSKKNPASVTDYFVKNEQAAVDVLSALGPGDLDMNKKVKNFVEVMFGTQAYDACKYLCLEKSPRIVTVAGRVAQALPEAGFVHMHRDPLDVYCSVRSKTWGPNDIKTFVESYNKVMHRALSERKMVPEGRYLTVQMEQLVENPMPYLMAMAKLFGLDYDFIHEAVSVVSQVDAHTGRWRSELSEEDAGNVWDGCREVYSEWRKLSFQP